MTLEERLIAEIKAKQSELTEHIKNETPDERKLDGARTVVLQWVLDRINILQQDKWHPATESPGKRRVLMAFTRKDLKAGQYLFNPVRFFKDGSIPAECEFLDDKGEKRLPVAWTFYDDAVKGITNQMCKTAAAAAWGWWPDKKEK